MTNHPDFVLINEEMKEILGYQLNSMDSIKAAARSTFQSASLMVALIGALQIFRPVPQNIIQLYLLLLGIAALLYIILITLCVIVLAPADLHTSIEPTWDTIRKYFIGKDEKELLKIQLSAYLNAINLNQPVLHLRRNLTTISNILFPIIVLLLVILGALPSLDLIRTLVSH